VAAQEWTRRADAARQALLLARPDPPASPRRPDAPSAAVGGRGATLVAARTWLARSLPSLRERCASLDERPVLLHAASATVRVRCASLEESTATVGLRCGSKILATAVLARRGRWLRPARSVLRGGHKRLPKPAILIPRSLSRHSRSSEAHSHSLRLDSSSLQLDSRTVASDSRSNAHRRATVAHRGNGNTLGGRARALATGHCRPPSRPCVLRDELAPSNLPEMTPA
jgi:hypothetical protein